MLYSNITLNSLVTLTDKNVLTLDAEAEERERETEGSISFKFR